MMRALSILSSLLLLCITSSAQNATSYTGNSLLATGHWVKVRVTSTGMHRISRQSLASWGFSDMSKVSLFSNGGGPLPTMNNAKRVNDLAQIPVLRTENAVLFYAESVEKWDFNQSSDYYTCTLHPSDDASYVFITDAADIPSQQPQISEAINTPSNYNITSYSHLLHHELHEYNLLNSGRDWYGEALTVNKKSLTIDFGKHNVVAGSTIRIRSRMMTNGATTTPFTIALADTTLISNSARAITSSEDGVNTQANKAFKYAKNNIDAKFTITAQLSSLSYQMWLDYVTIEIQKPLDMGNDASLLFNIAEGVRKNPKSSSNVTLKSSLADIVLWDVSDATTPIAITLTSNGNSHSFTECEDKYHRYIAFSPSKESSFPEPTFVETVKNQNLHGLGPADFIIVTHPDFLQEAEQIADIHRDVDRMIVHVATTSDIYNEFSCGQRDITAIRDFVRYIYLQDSKKLKYLLLFGDASYNDYDYGEAYPHNRVPTYESAQSLVSSQSYATDDFFGWLDENEPVSDTRSNVDIGIGRFAISTKEEAETIVKRLSAYINNPPDGAWKNNMVFLSGPGDDNEHTDYAEKNAKTIESLCPDINITRIYAEAYPQVQSSTGTTYPAAVTDFYKSVNSTGALLCNYVGHGGWNALSVFYHNDKIFQFSNGDRLPFFIGATCDFAPYDNVDKNASDLLIKYPYGGFIGIFAANRLVYGSSNFQINNALLKRLLSRDALGRRYRVGEAVMYAKRQTSSLINSLKYNLLGDPAMVLANNQDYVVTTDSVCGEPYESSITPIRALAENHICGSVKDRSGNLVSDFNGKIEATLYDKRRDRKTTGIVSAVYPYSEWGNCIYSGTFDVKNGHFDIPVQMSKDIDSNVGYGRISYAAWDSESRKEASGSADMILVGGIAESAYTDTIGPVINAYLDAPSWQNGSATGTTPVVHISLYDESGLNASGLGIGHDMSITIDGNSANAIRINDYFSYDGGCTSGKIVYTLPELEIGRHSIQIKAWDNLGNSSTYEMNLYASANLPIYFSNVSIYPTAFAENGESLRMNFSHNNASATSDITIEVYDIHGRQIAHAKTGTSSSGANITSLDLTALMPELLAIPRGVYIVKLYITSQNGRQGELVRKIIN
ncbi:MAG: type IX secretion system sortase PorU [Marinilabiliaceae bacterium]|nr:type IX secretion system sortase PorU [Marinilabiliaceae bacterium]